MNGHSERTDRDRPTARATDRASDGSVSERNVRRVVARSRTHTATPRFGSIGSFFIFIVHAPSSSTRNVHRSDARRSIRFDRALRLGGDAAIERSRDRSRDDADAHGDSIDDARRCANDGCEYRAFECTLPAVEVGDDERRR